MNETHPLGASTARCALWSDWLVALAAGVALTGAFSPFNGWWIAPISLVLLFAICAPVSPRRAAAYGFVFGLAHYTSGVYWVTISLHTFGGAPQIFAILATGVLILYLALYPTVFAYLLNRITPRQGLWRWALVAPCLWLLLEFVRSVVLNGFPWLSLGYSQTDGPLKPLIPILGVFGLSAIIVATAGLALAILTRSAQALRVGSSLAAIVALSVIGLRDHTWTEPLGAPIQVALVQGNIDQREKFLPGNSESQLSDYIQYSLPLAESNDVIVWPETAIPVFFDQLDRDFIERLEAHAAQTHTEYLSGIIAGDWRNGQYFNALVRFGAGTPPRFYYKRKLLPFGEYLPLRVLFNAFHRWVQIPMADFTPGPDEQILLIAGGQPVGVSICFEVVFGNEIRRALPTATWLVNVSNDAWFGDSLAPHQHLQMARFRAIETQRPMVRATNTGLSAFIEPDGRISAIAPAFVPAQLSNAVQPRQGSTPYVRFGDGPSLAVATLGLLLGALGARASRRR